MQLHASAPRPRPALVRRQPEGQLALLPGSGPLLKPPTLDRLGSAEKRCMICRVSLGCRMPQAGLPMSRRRHAPCPLQTAHVWTLTQVLTILGHPGEPPQLGLAEPDRVRGNGDVRASCPVRAHQLPIVLQWHLFCQSAHHTPAIALSSSQLPIVLQQHFS